MITCSISARAQNASFREKVYWGAKTRAEIPFRLHETFSDFQAHLAASFHCPEGILFFFLSIMVHWWRKLCFLNLINIPKIVLMSQFKIAYLFGKPSVVHDVKKRRRKCRRCMYGYQKRISQPFSFISLLVSTVNALINEKIWSFKSAFHRWCAQYSKINLQSGVDLSKLLPFQVGLYSSRLLRSLKKDLCTTWTKDAKEEKSSKKNPSFDDCRLRFCWKASHYETVFLWICFKRTQNEKYSWRTITYELLHRVISGTD